MSFKIMNLLYLLFLFSIGNAGSTQLRNFNHPKDSETFLGKKKIVLAGGVSANSYIRARLDSLANKENLEMYYPELKLCTDNAAMIASSGYYHFIKGERSDLKLNAIPNLKLGE